MLPYFIIHPVVSDHKTISLKAELKNGPYQAKRPSQHYPSGKEIRILDMEVQNEKYLLKVKGIARRDLRDLDCILPQDWGGAKSKVLYFYSPRRGFQQGQLSQWKDPLSPTLRRVQGEYIQKDHLVLVRCKNPQFAVPGLEYTLGDKLSSCVLLFHESINQGQQSFVQKALSDWKKEDPIYRQVLALRLALLKSLSLPLEHQDIEIPKSKKGSGFMVSMEFWDKEKQRLLKRLSKMGGERERDLKEDFPRILKSLLIELEEQGTVGLRKGYYQRTDRSPEENLAPFSRSLLSKLRESNQGLSPSRLSDAERNQFQQMDRMGLCRYSSQWICSEEMYQKFKEEVVKALKSKVAMELQDMKALIPLSRREWVEILAWMEDEGVIVNEDNIRRLP